MTDPRVREGLRALREQMPSDESRRATLARLGIGDLAEAPATTSRAATGRGPVRWLLWGLLLGVIALALRRWLV